jgi:NTP pyrophosphatase (non-canonical NTP hydrolase)
MKNIKEKVLEWANERNLLHNENALKQYSKLQEESNELLIGILDKDPYEIIDALGDIQVVLIILANQLGFDIDECLESAYNEIKDRKGKTIGGNFIKE